MPRLAKLNEKPDALSRPLAPGRIPFCALGDTFSLTPCFSWGLGDVLTRQPFQRLWAEGKPLKAVARLRPASTTQLKQGVNETVRSWCSETGMRPRCAGEYFPLDIFSLMHYSARKK